MPLDENLPTFYLKPSPDNVKHHQAAYFTQHGSEPEPAYVLKHLDPAAPQSRSCYAAALFDSYNPDVLYGEVLAQPGWTQPTLLQEEIRKNGGVPPPPQPILPTEFTIQLYNPDSQVVVRQKEGKWGAAPSYEFSVPQNTFRTPSGSTLDRTLNDPASDITTPKLNFVWKKEGRMSKDFSCYMTGKSTDPQTKKKGGKEADITVALFSGLKEVTLYEPNMYRVDIEDPKGFEVILILGACVIRDLYFNPPKETFHLGDARKNSGGILGRKGSSPIDPALVHPPLPGRAPQQNGAGWHGAPRQNGVPPQGLGITTANAAPQANGAPPAYAHPSHKPQTPNDVKRQSLPPLQTSPQGQRQPQPGPSQQRPLQQQRPPQQQQQRPPPPLDPRSQWEIDAETARLRAQAEAEARAQQRAEEARRRERERQAEAESRRLRKQLEHEEKERRRKQAEVDKETERLRKKYGNQENLIPPQAQHRHSAPLLQGPFQRPSGPQQPPRQPQPQCGSNGLFVYHPPQPQRPQAQVRVTQPMRPSQPPRPQGPYLQAPGPQQAASSSSFFGGGGLLKPDDGKRLKACGGKKSFWGLRSKSDQGATLQKKKSSMF